MNPVKLWCYEAIRNLSSLISILKVRSLSKWTATKDRFIRRANLNS